MFNSFANFGGHILNNNCAKSPDILDNLLAILIWSQENYIALTADIEKMYHTVKITNQDQHGYQFL